ncbi:MAG: formylglycine-generating enzyme family protein [Candidatus Nitrospinota bacterium M3_3B_026]
MRNLCLIGTLVVIATVLAAGGSPAARSPEGMVFIPGGEFLMGSSAEEVEQVRAAYGKRRMYRDYAFDAETPKRKVRLKAFYIDRHEVTNEEYYEFVKATGHRAPRSWLGGKYEAGRGDSPVLYVSKEDAEAYARWAGKRLPTEAEWEKAARGADGRIYPWGDRFDPYKAATAESDIKYIYGALCSANSANPVEIAEGDVSPYGVHDMGGNVREWTATEDIGHKMAVVKGASWVDLSINARAAHREFVPRGAVSHIIGFRLVKDAADVDVAGSL